MSPAIELQEEKDMTVKKLADPLLDKQVVCADGANSPDVQKLLDATGVATVDELIALIGSLKDQVAAAQGEIEMACQSDKFNKMMSEGKAVEAQRKFFMEKDFENFAAHSMPIKLEEISKNEKVVEEDEEKAEDKIMKLAEAKMSEEKISLTEAIGQVLSEDKELNKQYRKEKGSKSWQFHHNQNCFVYCWVDLSAHQYHFVKFGADALHVIAGTAGVKCIGVLQNAPALGQMAEVALLGAGSKVKAVG